MMQRPFAPRAGFVAAVDGDPYPAFPVKPLERIRWAAHAPIPSAPAKAVAVMLALYANQDEGRAWLAVKSLAARVSMSRSTTLVAINNLAVDGWLTVEDRRPYTSNYRLKAPWQRHCWQCWFALPAETELCPSCGAGKVRELDLKVREPDLEETRKTQC